jgi:hypothetical protein
MSTKRVKSIMNYKKALYWIIRNVYIKILPDNEKVIFKGLTKGDTIIDLGCGENSFLRHHKNQYETTGIDKHKKSIVKSRKKRIHGHYYVLDVMKAYKKFGDKSFDAVFCFDLIEHLTKREGLELLKDMERMARKKVVVLTPQGYYEQEPFNNNKYQQHKSGWNIDEFRKRGYEVYGYSGLKNLFQKHNRSNKGHRPIRIMLSDISRVIITKKHPEYDFHLLCVKNLNSPDIRATRYQENYDSHARCKNLMHLHKVYKIKRGYQLLKNEKRKKR